MSNGDIFERKVLYLGEANIIFDRFTTTIDQINTKISGLFQTFLVLVTFQITIIGFRVSNETLKFSTVLIGVLIVNCLIVFITFTYFFYLLWPKNYHKVEVLDDDRFSQLADIETKDELVETFLSATKTAYTKNQQSYDLLSGGLQKSLFLIAAYFISLSIFIIFSI